MKKILITGAAGFIAPHIIEESLKRNWEVIAVDLKEVPENLKYKDVKYLKKDVRNLDKDDLKAVDFIAHLAFITNIPNSIKYPIETTYDNIDMSAILLKKAEEANVKKVIFSSTASVYGNPIKDNVAENDDLSPLNPYAETKLNLEKYILDKSKSENISYIILRYFNVAGADEKLRSGLISKHSTHLIKIASEVAVGKRDEIIINGNDYDTRDGTTIRDYIHVSDLADIHLVSAKYLLDKNQSNIFNCGYGNGYSVKEVINTYNKFLDKKIKSKIGPRRPGDSKMVVADPSKFNKTLNWEPKFNNLEYILKTAYEWEKKIN